MICVGGITKMWILSKDTEHNILSLATLRTLTLTSALPHSESGHTVRAFSPHPNPLQRLQIPATHYMTFHPPLKELLLMVFRGIGKIYKYAYVNKCKQISKQVELFMRSRLTKYREEKDE